MQKVRQFIQKNNTRILGTVGVVTSAGLVSSASAQTTTGAPAALNGMVTASGTFITDLISANAGPLMTAMLPVLGLVFIKNQVRSIF